MATTNQILLLSKFYKHIFKYINTYINLKSLCDSCKSLSKCKKYVMKIYKLKQKDSLDYYNSESFRNNVLNEIVDPCKQLHLNLSQCYGIKDMTALLNVNTLNLSGCHLIEDISALSNVHT